MIHRCVVFFTKLVVASLMVMFGFRFCIFSILLNSDVSVNFYNVEISSSAERTYLLCPCPSSPPLLYLGEGFTGQICLD